jgi:hypothetical protein
LYGARCLDLSAAADAPPFTTLPAHPTVTTPLGWHFDVTLAADAAGAARGTLVGRAFGPEASGLRHVYLNAGQPQRKQLWQQWTASVLPGARVTAAAVENARDADKAFVFRLDLEIPGYLRPDGARLVASQLLPPLLANALAAVPSLEELVALPQRQTPLRLADHAESVTLRLTLPEGLVPAADWGQVNEDDGTLSARQTVRLEGDRTLLVERRVTIAPGRVEPAAYGALRARVNKVIEELSHGVVSAPR